MNILIVAEYFPPDLGGAATRAYNLAKGLTLNRCKVTVVTAFPHYPHGSIPKQYQWFPLRIEQMESFRVIRTFMPPVKLNGLFKRIAWIGSFTLSSLFALPFVGKVDAIWAASWLPGYMYSKFKNCLVAFNVDDLTLEDLVDLDMINEKSILLHIGEEIYRLFYVKADIITPISPAYKKVMINKYCVKPERIQLIRGGVDLTIFKPAKKQAKSEKFTVIYSGGLSVAYDFDQIFRAAQILEEQDRNIEFIIQGKGEQLNVINKTVKALNLKNVKIFDKLFSRAEVSEFLGLADALILPLADFKKPYPGMSSKLYEYQAVGKPIIACSRGVPSTYVEESRSGIVVDPGDAQALAKAVLELKNDPNLTLELGNNGRKYVEEEGSIEAIGFRMKEIFIH